MAALGLYLKCSGCEENKECTAPATHIALTGTSRARCQNCKTVNDFANARKYKSFAKRKLEETTFAANQATATAKAKYNQVAAVEPMHITTGRPDWTDELRRTATEFIAYVRLTCTTSGASLQRYLANQSILKVGGGGFELSYKIIQNGTAKQQLALWKAETEQDLQAGRAPCYLHQLYKHHGESKRFAEFFAWFVARSSATALAHAPARLGAGTLPMISWMGFLLRFGLQMPHLDCIGHAKDQMGAFMEKTHGTTWVGPTTSKWTPVLLAEATGYGTAEVHTMEGILGTLLQE